jgi:hypothetical protein
MFFYDLVDNEHGRLAQCCCRHGRHHSRPRFMQPETKTESSPSVREEKREHRTKARTFASAANGGEVGDEGEESVEDLSCTSTRCEMQLFIVWMMARISERETGRKTMSLPRSLRCLCQSRRAGPYRGIPRVLRGLAGVQKVLCICPPVIL